MAPGGGRCLITRGTNQLNCFGSLTEQDNPRPEFEKKSDQ